MSAGDETTAAEAVGLPETVQRRRVERERRIAEIRARKSEIKVEPSPGLQQLVDSQDEFRDRVMSNLRHALGT